MKKILFFISGFLFMVSCTHESAKLAQTPPMGWNSWDCFGMDITDEQMKATADYMAEHLKSYGWEYVVLDMGWNYGEGLNTNNFRMRNPPQIMDEFGRLVPNLKKFPSAADGKGLKPLADYIHGKGLKFGIHIMRGIPWQAVEQNTPIKGTSYRAKDIVSLADSCRWFHGMVGIDMSKPGAQEYYNSLLELYNQWEVDYIKADDILSPYRDGDIAAISSAIKKGGRPVVLSLSAGIRSTEVIDHLRTHANLWRISGDMWDHWSFIKHTFEVCRKWQDHISPGHWPDADMIPIGKLRINGTDGYLANRIKVPKEETFNEFDRLSTDEKFSLMNLWIIFRSPLMMGGNVMEYNGELLKLFTNEETLEVNQKSTNNRELRASEDEIVWVADVPGKEARYVAFFNVSDDQPRKIKVTWNELGIPGSRSVRDLWKKENAGKFEDGFEVLLEPHASRLIKVY